MTARVVKVTVRNMTPLGRIPTYVGKCCREWELAIGFTGRCGLCGEIPAYVRDADA